MTITNFSARLDGSTVICNWDATELYSWIYADAEMISELPKGVTAWSGAYVSGAVYQAVDSATPTPVPAQLEPMPPKYLRISWNEATDTDLAKYQINLNDGIVGFVDKGSASYIYRTPRLDSGVNTIAVIAIDKAGNKLSTVSELSYEIESVPPPVEGLVLSQSGAGNLTIDITPPVGW